MTFTSPLPRAQPGLSLEKAAGTSILLCTMWLHCLGGPERQLEARPGWCREVVPQGPSWAAADLSPGMGKTLNFYKKPSGEPQECLKETLEGTGGPL